MAMLPLRRISNRCAALLLVLVPAAALAGPDPAAGSGILVSCQTRALPSLRQVSDLTGQFNSYQLHATRARLMAEAGRACQRPGIARVRLLPAWPAAPAHGAVSPPEALSALPPR